MNERNYTEGQVFAVELRSHEIAARLAGEWPFRWHGIELDTLGAIIYDALIALREDMIEEEGHHD